MPGNQSNKHSQQRAREAGDVGQELSCGNTGEQRNC